jgi:alginate O-acetyltransferase complex protein AlgI
MAIGLGKMIGFKFPENFNFPYLSRSITEFWQRWHITLGTWMRDYLYIPLGGNKKGFAKTLINLGLVFLLSGLWHGAAWNFALWGLFHGSFLILERLFFKKILDRIPSFIAITYVFLVVLFGWVLFASTSLNQLFLLIGKMFEFNVNFSEISVSYKFLFFFSLAIIGSFIGINSKNINKINHFQNTIQNQKNVIVVPLFIIVLFILTLCIGDLLAGTFNPFIYYRF